MLLPAMPWEERTESYPIAKKVRKMRAFDVSLTMESKSLIWLLDKSVY